ncbi:Ras-GAP domain-containing protein [Mycena venus]|uniref:Ras-GAP domain-containing protein n=1 Tax=Mycena venus TaxID=2733690 RepID=A0A8H6TW82_9AGAR|nr:Ras-GAP domain-containing protein [Mycena venus]
MPHYRLPYTPHSGAKSHSGNILALAITEDGKTLASGVQEVVATLCLCFGPDKPTNPMTFYTPAPRTDTFFCWRQDKLSKAFEETFALQITHSGEITSLAFDSTNNRLCLCSCTDIIQSWTISKDANTGKWKAHNIFSQKYANLVPRLITFAAFDNSSDRDIIVFGSGHNGPIYILRGKTGERKADWSVGAYIGSAVVDWKEGLLCLNDPYVGPALFRHADQTKARSFEVRRELPGDPFSSDVCFGENGSTVVTGSDHGIVYVFDTRSGDAIQELETGRSQRIKAVATTEMGGVPVIVAAYAYSDEGFQEILVWKRVRATTIGWDKVGMLLKVLVLLGFVAFIYQNLVERHLEFSIGETVDSL